MGGDDVSNRSPSVGSRRASGRVGEALPHESAELHVSGEARYIDDLPEPSGTLYAAVGVSSRAHARIRSVDVDALRSAPGVVDVMVARDIPGANDLGGMVKDDPVLADGVVQYVGQSVFAVAATSVELARRAARMEVVEAEVQDRYRRKALDRLRRFLDQQGRSEEIEALEAALAFEDFADAETARSELARLKAAAGRGSG